MTHEEEQKMKPGEWNLKVNQDLTSGCRYTLTVRGGSTAFTYYEDKVRDFIRIIKRENTVLLIDMENLRQALLQTLRPYIEFSNESGYFGQTLQVGPFKMYGITDLAKQEKENSFTYRLEVNTGRLYWLISDAQTCVLGPDRKIFYDNEESGLYALVNSVCSQIAEARMNTNRLLEFLNEVWIQERITENVIVGGIGGRPLTPAEIRATLERMVNALNEKIQDRIGVDIYEKAPERTTWDKRTRRCHA